MTQQEILQLSATVGAIRDKVNARSGTLENITITHAGCDVVVEGNTAGLLELARLVLMVASKDVDGAHQDFDGATFASRADGVLTVALNKSLQ
jgi:hypothetical protein